MTDGVFKRNRYGHKANPDKCAAAIWPQNGIDYMQCNRAGVVEEGGHKWCKQHQPSAAKARREKIQAVRDAKYKQRYVGYDIHAARLSIAEVAIEAAHQRASIDDVFAAVGAYEDLVEKLAAMKADHKAKGLIDD